MTKLEMSKYTFSNLDLQQRLIKNDQSRSCDYPLFMLFSLSIFPSFFLSVYLSMYETIKEVNCQSL